MPAVAAELARLEGQRVERMPSDAAYAYTIVDVAGEGRPLVGLVERRGEELWLVPSDADAGTPAVRLIGSLAHPRLAGPGYKVWVLGVRVGKQDLRARRLGVLATPAPSPAP